MTCNYCNNVLELVNGKRIYPYISKLHSKKYWLCTKCDAYVGCHEHTDKPLGTVANKQLRKKRLEVHKIFDTMWKERGLTRTFAYIRLATLMDLPRCKCHIGMFDLEQCEKALSICKTSF